MKKLLMMAMMLVSVSASGFARDLEVSFKQRNIETIGDIQVKVGPCTFHNSQNPKSWVMQCRGSSFIKLTFFKASAEEVPASIDMTHLASWISNGGYSPITMVVNNQVVFTGYSPVSDRPYDGGWNDNTFELTPYLVEGQNTIMISLDHAARSTYWIQKLSIHIDD